MYFKLPEVPCKVFTVANAVAIPDKVYVFGDSVTVTCDSGYVSSADGESKTFTAVCKETRTWDGIKTCTSKLYFVSCIPFSTKLAYIP